MREILSYEKLNEGEKKLLVINYRRLVAISIRSAKQLIDVTRLL